MKKSHVWNLQILHITFDGQNEHRLFKPLWVRVAVKEFLDANRFQQLIWLILSNFCSQWSNFFLFTTSSPVVKLIKEGVCVVDFRYVVILVCILWPNVDIYAEVIWDSHIPFLSIGEGIVRFHPILVQKLRNYEVYKYRRSFASISL